MSDRQPQQCPVCGRVADLAPYQAATGETRWACADEHACQHEHARRNQRRLEEYVR